MTDELEKKLRAALRPVDPDEGFTDRVLVRVDRGDRPAEDSTPVPIHVARPMLQRWPLALAASVALVAGFVGVHLWQQHERAAGQVAREQLMEALRMTSEKLDLAYDSVNPPTRRDGDGNGDEGSGA